MNVFDMIGPIMVGPSSSHTAGAVRIGYIARKLLSDKPVKAHIYLHGSFAATGTGHGTDKALIAGLLGMCPDDMRIPDSFRIAQDNGLLFSFDEKTIRDAHPNTALLVLDGTSGHTLKIQGASVGGGRIEIQKLDGIAVRFSCERPTLIVNNVDQPGYVADVASVLAKSGVNIAAMQLYRDKKNGHAVMVLETDEPVAEAAVSWLRRSEGIRKVTYFDMEGK